MGDDLKPSSGGIVWDEAAVARLLDRDSAVDTDAQKLQEATLPDGCSRLDEYLKSFTIAECVLFFVYGFF